LFVSAVFIFPAIINVGTIEGLVSIEFTCIPLMFFLGFFQQYLITRRSKAILLVITLGLSAFTTLLIELLGTKYHIEGTDRQSLINIILWSVPIIIILIGIFRSKDIQKKDTEAQSLPVYISDDLTEIRIPTEYYNLVERISSLLKEHGIKYNIRYPSEEIFLFLERPRITIVISMTNGEVLKDIYKVSQEYFKEQSTLVKGKET